jgi:hypothetical protein
MTFVVDNGGDGGLLLFGSEDSLPDDMTVKATYNRSLVS